MSLPAIISNGAPTKRDLAAHLAALTDEQLQSLAYGEFASVVLDCEVPDWLAEAAYDEQDRRMMARLAKGPLPPPILTPAPRLRAA